jgi:hypothetical protein
VAGLANFGQVVQRSRRIDGRHLASAIEWTIESRVNRLLGDFIAKMFGA